MSAKDPAKSATNLILENFGVTSGYQEFGSARIDTETFIRAAYRPLLQQLAAALDWAIASQNMPDHDNAIMQLYAVRADVRAALGE